MTDVISVYVLHIWLRVIIFSGCLVAWLPGWLVDQLTGWLVGCLAIYIFSSSMSIVELEVQQRSHSISSQSNSTARVTMDSF